MALKFPTSKSPLGAKTQFNSVLCPIPSFGGHEGQRFNRNPIPVVVVVFVFFAGGDRREQFWRG